MTRNPGINPWGLDALYEYFHKKPTEELESLLPDDPLNFGPNGEEEGESQDAAVQNYIAIFFKDIQ